MATVTISTKIAGGHRNNLWYEVQMCILIHPIHPTAQLPGFHEEQLGDSATTPNEIPRYRRSTPLIDTQAATCRHCHQGVLVDGQVITGLRCRKLWLPSVCMPVQGFMSMYESSTPIRS